MLLSYIKMDAFEKIRTITVYGQVAYKAWINVTTEVCHFLL